MENMYFKNREEYNSFLDDHITKRLGFAGREGICALLDNGMVVKSLFDEYYPDFALQFKDLDVPSFVFAKSGAFLDDFVIGLFMDYADGVSISDHKPTDQNIVTLGEHLDTVVQDIKTISNMGILVKDFHCGDIMYDSDKFKIVDTLPYLLLNKGNYKENNIYEIMNRLYAGILGDLMKHEKISKNFSFSGNLDYLENPKEYLLVLKNYIEELTEKEINTLDDAQKTLKKV